VSLNCVTNDLRSLCAQSPGKSPSKKRYSAASVTNTLDELSGLPIYLRTLEKDLELRDMKIKHLQNEVQRCVSVVP
jgi:hypothetical protein